VNVKGTADWAADPSGRARQLRCGVGRSTFGVEQPASIRGPSASTTHHRTAVRLAVAEPSAHKKSAAGPRAAPYAKAVSPSPTAETPSGLPFPTKRCTKVRNWVARGPYAKPVSPSPTAEPLNH